MIEPLIPVVRREGPREAAPEADRSMRAFELLVGILALVAAISLAGVR